MPLRALLFDIDGTLADTEPKGHLPAYNRAFRDLGLGWKWSRAFYRKLLTLPGGRERIAHYLDTHDPELGGQRDQVENDRADWIKRLHQRKSRHFEKHLEAGRVPLRPGVRRLLLEAGENGLQIALVTNASKASCQAFLRHGLAADLRAHVQAVVCCEDVHRKKPAPDVYVQACQRLGRNVDECVAMEDSAIGLQAARAAGVHTVVTMNNDTRAQDFTGALLVVDNLGEPGSCCRIVSRTDLDACYVNLDLLSRLLQTKLEQGETDPDANAALD